MDMQKEKEIKDQNVDELAQEVLKPNRSKAFIIGGVLIGQLIAAALLVYFLIIPAIRPSGKKASQEKKQQVQKTRELGMLITLDDLTINPKDSYGRRFAVLELAMEVEDEAAKMEVEKFHPVIKDRVLTYLRSLTVADLTIQLDVDKMKRELMTIVNNTLGKSTVKNLYITRLVLE